MDNDKRLTSRIAKFYNEHFVLCLLIGAILFVALMLAGNSLLGPSLGNT